MIRVAVPFAGLFLMLCGFFNVAWAQCPAPTEVYLPVGDLAKYDYFGLKIDTYGDYMVASEMLHDSLEVEAGLLHVYRLDASQQWKEIAQLTPSDPQIYLRFGMNVTIDATSIVASAQSYDDAGNLTNKLYVFEKVPGSEWVSGTESYQLLGTPYLDAPVLSENNLIALASQSSNQGVAVFTKTGGVFTLTQFLPFPVDENGMALPFPVLTAGDGLIAAGSAMFQNADGTVGTVILYEKNGATFSTSPVATLRPADDVGGMTYGRQIAIHNGNVYTGGWVTGDNGTGIFKSLLHFYEFKKPVSGWANAKTNAAVKTPYGTSESLIVTDDEFFFGGYQQVHAYKKNGSSWSSVTLSMELSKPASSTEFFGLWMSLTNNHLVVGGPAAGGIPTPATREAIIDYYRPPGGWATNTPPHQIITKTTLNATGDLYGSSITSLNNELFVGAPGDDEMGLNSGAVYVHTKGKPTSPAVRIFEPKSHNRSGFGQSIAAGDNILVVGAPFVDSVGNNGINVFDRMGKAYIYKRTATGWKYHSQLVAPTLSMNGSFGQTVAYFNKYIAVCAYDLTTYESDGRVYLYKENDAGKYVYLATLRPSIDIKHDFFGRAIVMSENTIVVGTGDTEREVGHKMHVFVFEKHGEWKSATEDARLLPTNKGYGDMFGYSVAMEGDRIVVGAPGYPGTALLNDQLFYRGAAYIFKKPASGWSGTVNESAQLEPSDATSHGNFGYSVAIDDDQIYAGSPFAIDKAEYPNYVTNHDNTLKPGKVYRFVRNGSDWLSTKQEDEQIASISPDWLDGFGCSLYVTNHKLYIGATYADTERGFWSGSVETYTRAPLQFDIPELPVSCDDRTLKLDAAPEGGVWSGPGVTADATFDPKNFTNEKISLRYHYTTIAGCQTDTTVTVTVNKLLPASLTPGPTLCITSPVTLSITPVDPGATATWMNVSTNTPAQGSASALVVDASGSYVATVSRDGCTVETAPVVVNKLTPPALTASHPSICNGVPVTISLTPFDNGTTVTWTDLSTHATLPESGGSIAIKTGGTFSASVSQNGCVLESPPITLQNMRDSVYVPNIFTPNDDHYNDYFEVRGEDLSQFNLRIYNRLGTPVYHTDDPAFRWTAPDVSTGVYYWNITYLGCDSEQKHIKGWVHVLR